jgi:hypothetical protein
MNKKYKFGDRTDLTDDGKLIGRAFDDYIKLLAYDHKFGGVDDTEFEQKKIRLSYAIDALNRSLVSR